MGREMRWYKGKRKDMVMEVGVGYRSGLWRIMENMGWMKNRGVELCLGVDIIKRKEMLLELKMKYGYNKNEMSELLYGYEEWGMGSYCLS